MTNDKQTLNTFRITALAEGISYVVLLFIAMPLKYFADIPEAVKYIGWVHGLLFMAYVYLLVISWSKYRWSFSRVIVFFVAALVPFGAFWVERKLKRE